MRSILLTALVMTMLVTAIDEAMAQQVSSYRLPIMRLGRTDDMVVYNFWSGEYPGPVANVSSALKGATTVQAFRSLRVLDNPISCAIANGIYHPWGASPSLISWYSITPQSTYTAKVPSELKYNGSEGRELTVSLKLGEKLEREVYLSEGICRISLTLDGRQAEVDTSCSNFSENAALEHKVGGGRAEQWLYVQCADGTKAFINDKALLAQPGVKEGQITGYGSVAP